jgi:hypothetical protein
VLRFWGLCAYRKEPTRPQETPTKTVIWPDRPRVRLDLGEGCHDVLNLKGGLANSNGQADGFA